MPFYKEIVIRPNTILYLWKITETYNDLFRQVVLKDSSLARLEKMKAESHQKGFLAVRMLLQHCGYNDFDLEYDETGKPNLKLDDGCQVMDEKQITHHISISHSFGFSAIVISNEQAGLDIEQCKEKVLRIAPRFMDLLHLDNLPVQEQIQKATVIWGVKESIFKIKNEVGISFPDHIFESEFNLQDKKCKAQLHFNNEVEDYEFHFDLIEDYAYVCAFKS